MTTLLVMQLADADVQTVKQTLSQTPNLEVLVASQPLTDAQLAKVEVTLGWEPTLGQRLLGLPQSQLKWVQAFSAGVDYLPLEAFAKAGVMVSNVSGIHATPISEFVMGGLLYHTRGIDFAAANQQKATWQRPAMLGVLAGQQMLVYGTGHIGQAIAKLAQAFGMKTVGVNHDGHPVDFFDKTVDDTSSLAVAVDSDVIVNVLPLTAKTHHFFNAEFFGHLSKKPVFVNVGRGPSVDTSALIEALKTTLAYAVIDVVEPEPLPANSPLWQADNVLLAPHMSGLYTDYAKDALAIFGRNLAQFQADGTLVQNQVELDRGY
ncbi:phosphoglycerate dehydrogenase [Lacticaseibacillus brantae]|uniref:D-isomer specific 2-hydroxyacid dehydrogenase family protein n=1 Tax=Lacticaseibacillus brantae DSM 23927 TaxID=1423727 RepID=A0A0R2AVS4_9LACO|nr:phosphoglycerate dehydrogenase [Lacticaseibacillus brantae]KRM71534.1 D-isomer specific 2-hydroxyacid dehydrogenase family protein [Lacticaseibacillus brantae DSM 23927]